jgi:DNA-binding beta-propeller fold protein YncE
MLTRYWHRIPATVVTLAAIVACARAGDGTSVGTGCNAPLADSVAQVPLTGNPFGVVATTDGCWLFVSIIQGMDSSSGRIAVLRRDSGTVRVVREVPVPSSPTGMVLTHDGSLLVAASGPYVTFLDAARLTSGDSGAVLGVLADGGMPGHVYANVTPDDRFLFVSDERAQRISVIDLVAARRDGFTTSAIVGTIPVGYAPIALTFSPDGRTLYTTSQRAPEAFGWPAACRPEQRTSDDVPPDHQKGVVLVIDVARAVVQPDSSVIGAVAAGCNPVRLVLSPGGNTAWVSARNDNALLAFDTRRLPDDTAHALLGQVPVGTAPVGVAVIDEGRHVVVTNSNRFAGGADDRQTLTVVDAGRVAEGAGAVVGAIPAGGFPREMRVTADGRTLLVTNFTSKTLEVIDLTRMSFATSGR